MKDRDRYVRNKLTNTYIYRQRINREIEEERETERKRKKEKEREKERERERGRQMTFHIQFLPLPSQAACAPPHGMTLALNIYATCSFRPVGAVFYPVFHCLPVFSHEFCLCSIYRLPFIPASLSSVREEVQDRLAKDKTAKSFPGARDMKGDNGRETRARARKRERERNVEGKEG